MHPLPMEEVSGLNIRVLATGASSTILAVDDTTIAWGASPTYGELGFGEKMKSSTKVLFFLSALL